MVSPLIGPNDMLITDRQIVGWYVQALEAFPAAIFIENLSGAPYTSTNAIETYPWLSSVAKMREFTGQLRPREGFTETAVQIRNVEYENSLRIRESELRRDKTTQIKTRIDDFTRTGQEHWLDLLADLVAKLPTLVCHDGQYFFDTDHPGGRDGALQSNKIAVDISELPAQVHGSPAAPSVEEMAQAILKGVSAIKGFRDPDHQRLVNRSATKFQVDVPLSLWQTAQAAVSIPQTAGGQSNVLKAQSDLEITVSTALDLQWTDAFAVTRTDSSLKPIIRQVEVDEQLAVLGEGSEYAVLNKARLYSLYSSRGIGPGRWDLMARVQLT